MTESSRRVRVRRWIEDLIITWDDWAFNRGWRSMFWFPEWGVLDKVGSWTCWGSEHFVVDNFYCLMPKCRACGVCGKSLPGRALGRYGWYQQDIDDMHEAVVKAKGVQW